MNETLSAFMAVLGPLIGAGAGSYFGLKSAINGLRERSARMESTLGEVRDYTRDTALGFADYAKEGRAAMERIKHIDGELRR